MSLVAWPVPLQDVSIFLIMQNTHTRKSTVAGASFKCFPYLINNTEKQVGCFNHNVIVVALVAIMSGLWEVSFRIRDLTAQGNHLQQLWAYSRVVSIFKSCEHFQELWAFTGVVRVVSNFQQLWAFSRAVWIFKSCTFKSCECYEQFEDLWAFLDFWVFSRAVFWKAVSIISVFKTRQVFSRYIAIYQHQNIRPWAASPACANVTLMCLKSFCHMLHATEYSCQENHSQIIVDAIKTEISTLMIKLIDVFNTL